MLCFLERQFYLWETFSPWWSVYLGCNVLNVHLDPSHVVNMPDDFWNSVIWHMWNQFHYLNLFILLWYSLLRRDIIPLEQVERLFCHSSLKAASIWSKVRKICILRPNGLMLLLLYIAQRSVYASEKTIYFPKVSLNSKTKMKVLYHFAHYVQDPCKTWTW